jgi:hypothetical protein
MRHWLWASFAVVTLFATGFGSLRADPPDDELMKLNEMFRKQYAAARSAVLTKSGPVIIVEGDKLGLLLEGKRFSADIVLPEYHRLKAIAHAPVAAYLSVQSFPKDPIIGGKGPNPAREAARDLRNAVYKISVNVEKYGFAEAQVARQRQLLEETAEFLRPATKGAPFDVDATAFLRKMKPLIEANMADAARVQIDAIHAQVTAWRKQLSAEDWQKLRVVVIGSQMPRKSNLAVQYFAKLLKEPGEGKRIIYAEALFDEQKAVNLLGTHLVDTQLGAAFFDDPQRMHRDLLADAAAEYLKKMKVE